MKYSNYIGITAALGCIISCFLPWVHVQSLNLDLNGTNGRISDNLSFGTQLYTIAFFSLLMIILFLIPKVWAKRTNVLLGAIQLAWVIKNYLLFSACRDGECPDKYFGLYLLLLCSAIMFITSLFPKLELSKQ